MKEMKLNENFVELTVCEKSEISGGAVPFIVKAIITGVGAVLGYFGVDALLG